MSQRISWSLLKVNKIAIFDIACESEKLREKTENEWKVEGIREKWWESREKSGGDCALWVAREDFLPKAKEMFRRDVEAKKGKKNCMIASGIDGDMCNRNY